MLTQSNRIVENTWRKSWILSKGTVRNSIHMFFFLQKSVKLQSHQLTKTTATKRRMTTQKSQQSISVNIFYFQEVLVLEPSQDQTINVETAADTGIDMDTIFYDKKKWFARNQRHRSQQRQPNLLPCHCLYCSETRSSPVCFLMTGKERTSLHYTTRSRT